MKTRASNSSLHLSFAWPEWISLLVVILIVLPSFAFISRRSLASTKAPSDLKNLESRRLESLAPASPLSTIVVNTTGDANNLDSNIACDVDAGTPGEQCTLRAAIQRAETLAGDDTITFNIPMTQPDCDPNGACVINVVDELQISTNITIAGPGAAKLTVRRSTTGNYRVFLILSTGTVTFSGLTISDGNTTSLGGGILLASAGTVNVINCRIADNRALAGAGIANNNTGTVNITNSLITANFISSGDQGGGGIRNVSGTVNITNSVFYRNSGENGSAIRNVSGTVNISNSSIVRNTSAANAAIFGSANLKSTIVAQNDTLDVLGTFTSAGFNLIGKAEANSGFNQPTDQVGTNNMPIDPKLTNVSMLGMFVPVQPLCDSPAFDKGTSASLTGALTTDVRGLPRTIDDPGEPNTTGGDGTDIGAIERPPCVQLTFTVNLTGDSDDLTPSDAICDSDAGAPGPQCTLRAALSQANALTTDQTINFAIPQTDPGFDSTTGRYTINLHSPLPGITVNLAINGPGRDVLTVRRQAGGNYGIFAITSDMVAQVSFSDLTISDGVGTTSAEGGGIGALGSFSNLPFVLSIVNCAFTSNRGERGGAVSSVPPRGIVNIISSTFIGNSATSGGAIFARSLLSVSHNTFNANSAATSGGAIFAGGALLVSNSTFNANSATAEGGAILSDVTGRFGSISSSSFTGNSANLGGALAIVNPGPLSIFSSTISGNTASSSGGGIYIKGALSSSQVNVANSTISGNTAVAADGGGIASAAGELTLTSSTISGNNAATRGGGIYSYTIGNSDVSTVTIGNSTVTHNSAAEGGGVAITEIGRVTNSLIALNSASSAGPDLFSGTGFAFTSGGFNLIGKKDGSAGFSELTDQTGTIATPLDPKVDPAGLQNNGGPTRTLALLPGSPALDKGYNFGLATDQRGSPRPVDNPAIAPASGGDNTDIGAFEFNPAAPSPTPTPTPTSSPTPTPTPTPAPPTFQFDAPTYSIEEGCSAVTVHIVRSGPTSTTASIDITSEDGTAKQKGDYNFVTGHLTFAPGETEKVVHVLINDDSYVEGLEFATLILQHPINGTLGAQSTAMLLITDNASEPSANPIDAARGFVCQHYHDFLYREPDQAGEDFWTGQLEQCGTDAVCLRSKRTDVSTAFFLSIEFQQTGYFVIRSHKAAFGNLKSNPRYATFLGDQRHIGEGIVVGQGNWQQQLATNKQNYLADFVSRAEFVAVYPQGQPAAAYVDGLFINAGVAPTTAERNAAITAYGSGDTPGRAAALQSVVESGTVFNALYNPAFVLMQYYGYLRRNPDDLPDNNFNGYDFWLAKMNEFTVPGEDARNEAVALARVRRAEMVKAFIESGEYRRRFFGASNGNQEGQAVGTNAGP